MTSDSTEATESEPTEEMDFDEAMRKLMRTPPPPTGKKAMAKTKAATKVKPKKRRRK